MASAVEMMGRSGGKRISSKAATEIVKQINDSFPNYHLYLLQKISQVIKTPFNYRSFL